ncbi:IS30 family transposase [Candidatus Poriferisocius sp.]|uniref:IS30 family transposase n=1 Tax=Candidatus Poriferisocius sp. TaxID=3101276 RepID=UPI003B017E31
MRGDDLAGPMVKTLTWDQGTEMTRWAHIENALGIEVYFCEPRSPWQRPTNERTNGILRRWLPKSTDPDIGTARLAVIEDRINNMPGKLHNWNSAQTIYNDHCRDHQ